MNLGIKELKRDLVVLKQIKNNNKLTEEESTTIDKHISIVKEIIEDLEISGESIIEEK